MSDLKPCPHCGKPGLLLHKDKGGHAVICGGTPRCLASIGLYGGGEPFSEAEAIAAWNRRAPPPSPAPGVIEALRKTLDAVTNAGKNPLRDDGANYLARQFFIDHGETVLASISQPAKGEGEGGCLDDVGLSARLKEIAVDVFPSANKYAVADGVKNIVRFLERIEPAEYVVLHRSMYPFSYSAPDADDGQPDEAQEWHDYDQDC